MNTRVDLKLVSWLFASFHRFNRSELIVRVLKIYDVTKPTRIPARIIYAIHDEKISRSVKIKDMVDTLNRIQREFKDHGEPIGTQYSLRSQRDILVEKFTDMKSLKRYYDEQIARHRQAESQGRFAHLGPRKSFY